MSIPGPAALVNDLLNTVKANVDVALVQGATASAGTNFAIFETCKIWVIGQPAADKSPAKDIADWWKTNSAAITTAGLVPTAQVSSWAIVMDLTWRAAFTTPVRNKGTNDQVIPDPTAVDGQATGTTGDMIAVQISVLNQIREQPAFRLAQTITTKRTISPVVAQADSLKAASFYTTGLNVQSYTDMTKNTIYNLSWGSEATCDTKQWKDANACNGVTTPWAYGIVTDFNVAGPVKGRVRAWHWLADKGQDVTKMFSLEKGNKVNVLFYEFIDKKQGTAAVGAAWTAVGASAGGYAWAVTSFDVTGASTLFFGVTAIVASISATMF